MRETEIVPIEVGLKVQQTQKKRSRIDFKAVDLPIRMLGILFARAVPVSGLAPLGLSFLTLDRKFSFKSVVNLIFVCIGYLLLFDTELAVRYISASVIFELVLFVLERKTKPTIYFIGFAAAATLFVCEVGILLWTGITASGLILALCDVMIMLVGVVVFDRSQEVLCDNKLFKRNLVTDEKISLCIMGAIILLSTKTMTIFGSFNIANLLGCVLIGITAIKNKGLTNCVICGVVVGVLIGINGSFTEMVAIYSMFGLICGFASKFGKPAVSLTIGMCGIIMAIYSGIDTSDNMLPNIYELLLAAIAVYFMPEVVTTAVGKIIDVGYQNNDDDERFKNFTMDKLLRMSDSFYDLAETFSEISDKQSAVDMSDVALLFDTAADRVCKNCKNVEFCWQNDFNSTYKTMFRFLEIMEHRGVLTKDDIPEHFNEKCIRKSQLVTEINRLYEVYKINRIWKKKLAENRELTSEQFKGISEIIRNAASEIGEEKSFNIIASDEIAESLSILGIETERVEVICDRNGKQSVELSVVGCKDPDVCNDKIKPVIKKILGINVSVPRFDCDDRKYNKCRLRFSQAEGFDTNIGIAGRAQGEESGDRHYTNYLSDGKFVVTISDGMGTGHKAALESDTIVKLLGSFLEAGFDKTIAVKLVNSVMVMKSAHDAFATVDMCVIDLYTGEVEFIKNGAEASYIKHSDFTETVRTASLPIGIVSVVDIEAFARTLSNQSMVVMTSDGVIAKNNDDTWLRQLIEVVDSDIPPQEFAEIILEEAINRQHEAGIDVDGDDMTVICIKMIDRRNLAAQRLIKNQSETAPPKVAMF